MKRFSAELLRQAREKAGLTQWQASEKAAVLLDSIRGHEDGSTYPSVQTLEKYCDAYNCDVSSLFAERSAEPAKPTIVFDSAKLLRLILESRMSLQDIADDAYTEVGTLLGWAFGVSAPRRYQQSKLAKMFRCKPEELLIQSSDAQKKVRRLDAFTTMTLMSKKRMSYEQLADRSGLSTNTIFDSVHKNYRTRPQTCWLIAQGLGVSVLDITRVE